MDDGSLTPPLNTKMFPSKSISDKPMASGFSLYDDDDMNVVQPLVLQNNCEKTVNTRFSAFDKKTNACLLEDGELNDSSSPSDTIKCMKSKIDVLAEMKNNRALDVLKVAYVDMEPNQNDSDTNDESQSQSNKKSTHSKSVFPRNRSRCRSSEEKSYKKKRRKTSDASDHNESGGKLSGKSKFRKSSERERKLRRDRSRNRDSSRYLLYISIKTPFKNI